MIKKILIIFSLFFLSNANAFYKEQIISELKKINNFAFDFEQRIDKKEEKGNCIIKYPKKYFVNIKNLTIKFLCQMVNHWL